MKADFTIKAPYGVTTELAHTYDYADYSKLPDGAMFLRQGKVYQKMSDMDCAQLEPWDHDDYHYIPDYFTCERLKMIREFKT